MLLLENIPDLISLSNNSIIYGVVSDNVYSSEGLISTNRLQFEGVASPDEEFTLSWDDYEITFIGKSEPDDSGTQIPTYTGGTISNWVASIVPYLQANYYLSNDFNIYASTNNIYLVSYSKGTKYNITLSDALSGLTQIVATPGTDEVARDFYSIICKIFIESGAVSESIGEISLTPDNNETVYFDIAEILKSELTPDFSFPEDIDEIIIQRANTCRPYHIKYAEKYGVTPEAKKVYTTATKYCMLGGISDIYTAKYNESGSSWFEDLVSSQKFLTNQPTEKYIRENQIEKLYYLVFRQNTTNIRLQVKIYYTDGTDTTIEKYNESVENYNVYELIVTHDILEIKGISPLKTIKKYEVWLLDQNGLIISDIRTYFIEKKPFLFDKIFLFRNSLSGYDTFRTTGLNEKNLNVSKQDINQILPVDFSRKVASKKQLTNEQINVFKINTGWINKETAEYLAELFISEEKYIIINSQIIPIVINTDKIFIYKDDNHLYNISFEFEFTYFDKNYSKIIIDEVEKADFNDDFDTDFLNDSINL